MYIIVTAIDIHKHRDHMERIKAKTQRLKDSKTQRLKDSKTQRLKDPKAQRLKGAETQRFKDLNTRSKTQKLKH